MSKVENMKKFTSMTNEKAFEIYQASSDIITDGQNEKIIDSMELDTHILAHLMSAAMILDSVEGEQFGNTSLLDVIAKMNQKAFEMYIGMEQAGLNEDDKND